MSLVCGGGLGIDAQIALWNDRSKWWLTGCDRRLFSKVQRRWRFA